MTDCPICQKHRGTGPLVSPVVHEDDLVVVTHRPSGSLGYLFIEPRRHAPHLDALTDAEAESIGRLRSALARALRAELDIELVQALVSGRDVAHFHEHVYVRHTGTPHHVQWWQSWDDAPAGDVSDFSDRIAARMHRAAD